MSRADIFASQGKTKKAIADYTIAIELNQNGLRFITTEDWPSRLMGSRMKL